MSHVEGNAWAQMKAKEAHRQLDPGKGKSLSHQTTPRKFSGLDYDAELALPMPKPRHVRPSNERSPSASKPKVLTKPNVTKKRSTTEPTRSSESSTAASESTNAQKKKSKVAALRSKFSLKDIGKEFRRDIPPLSSMPKLGGVGQSHKGKRSSDLDNQSESQHPHNFNEERLYIPKSREEGDAPPHSAPLFQTFSTLCRSVGLDKASRTSGVSSSSLHTPTKLSSDGNAEGKFKHASVHNTDLGPSATNQHLETLLLDGSSPPARAGECSNAGIPEVIQVQSRVCSLEAQNESDVPETPKTPPPLPLPPIDQAAYSPSIYDTPQKVSGKTSESSPQGKNDGNQMRQMPLIVSSTNPTGGSKENKAGESRFPPQYGIAPSVPTKSRARQEHIQDDGQNHNPFNENNFFAGVTGYGGYAPPPSHPGYQNTVTLEQQLTTHVDSIHYHVDTVVNKLSRTFEDSNNWTMDQILRQVDAVSDIARLINSRTVVQAEHVKGLQRLMMDVRMQLNLFQQEARQSEDRLKGFVQQEMAKLRGELGEFLQSSSGGSSRGSSRALARENQGYHEIPKTAREGNKKIQNKRQPRQIKRDDFVVNKSTESHQQAAAVGGPSQEPSSTRSNVLSTRNQVIEEQGSSENIPTPTAAYRTPSTDNQNDIITPVPHQAMHNPPGEESLGSPESKAAKLRAQEIATQEKEKKRQSLEHTWPLNRESENKPSSAFSEDLKTPQKKGSMFSFRRRRDGDNHSGSRFLRTPRRNKDGKAGGEQGQSPGLAVPVYSKALATTSDSAPAPDTASQAGADPQLSKPQNNSPSMIHPALRNTQQKQIMLDREQARRYPQSRHGTGHTLRVSHSSHTRSRPSPEPRKPDPASSSSSSKQWPPHTPTSRPCTRAICRPRPGPNQITTGRLTHAYASTSTRMHSIRKRRLLLRLIREAVN
ncbi:hypothetical protein AOCH_004203 [Aspergillus ochraceoroseus]|uniref:Uncharacterized protein n=1 Tax=Aspergillus ochraceoroseus TaxID=138278 RepID=A0A0F8V5C2_9EURO|nr:hypothetical protein AOCH_004203 [Aspergillus ochraceoroseus]